MDLKKISDLAPTIRFEVTASDLKEFAEQLIDESARYYATKEKSDEFLTSKETCKLIGIDRSTLWKWCKTGYIPYARVGKELRFKRDNIDLLLNGKKK